MPARLAAAALIALLLTGCAPAGRERQESAKRTAVDTVLAVQHSDAQATAREFGRSFTSSEMRQMGETVAYFPVATSDAVEVKTPTDTDWARADVTTITLLDDQGHMGIAVDLAWSHQDSRWYALTMGHTF